MTRRERTVCRMAKDLSGPSKSFIAAHPYFAVPQTNALETRHRSFDTGGESAVSGSLRVWGELQRRRPGVRFDRTYRARGTSLAVGREWHRAGRALRLGCANAACVVYQPQCNDYSWIDTAPKNFPLIRSMAVMAAEMIEACRCSPVIGGRGTGIAY